MVLHPPVIVRVNVFLDVSMFSQTKSCSSFPEWLRLSLRPDKIFWAGEVKFCSTGSVFGDRHRGRLCAALCCLLLDMFMLKSAWHPAAVASWEDSCVVLDGVAVAPDVNTESSPSMYCTTSRGLSGTSTLLSVAWLGLWAFSQWMSKFWESLCGVPGSGEELRLLSALPGQSLAAAAGCLAARPGLESRAPWFWCR